MPHVFVSTAALGGFQVLTGNTAASDVTDFNSFAQCKNFTGDAPAGQSLTISCDVTNLARYVAIVRRASDVKLHFCEIEVLTALGLYPCNSALFRMVYQISHGVTAGVY